MEMRKNQEQDIREWFSTHIATKHLFKDESGRTITVIDWSRPDSGMYAIKYVLSGYQIFISGDLGNARSEERRVGKEC